MLATNHLKCRAAASKWRALVESLDFPQAEFFEAPAERNLGGHDFKIRHCSFRLLRRKAAYSVRLPGPWNSLPEHIVNALLLGAFKRSLDVAWPSPFPDRL